MKPNPVAARFIREVTEHYEDQTGDAQAIVTLHGDGGRTWVVEKTWANLASAQSFYGRRCEPWTLL